MELKNIVQNELEQMASKGSNVEDLKQLEPIIIDSMKNIDNMSPSEMINELSQDIIEKTKEFMDKNNDKNESLLTALQTCIYLPDFNSGEYKIKFLSGVTSDGIDVNDKTKFDIASITKMYTLLLTFKLSEMGLFSLDDKIADLDDRYIGMEDFTINDILLLCGKIYTDGNPKDGKDESEANKILSTAHLVENDRTRNLYTDLGAIILSKVIERKVSEKEGIDVNYSEIMDKYLFKPFGLNDTVFNPTNYNLAGNGNSMGLVHDPKARVLGGAVGSAGIFTNADDLAKLAREMYKASYINYSGINKIVSKNNLKRMGTITFPNSQQNNKGLLGLYQKNPDRENKWLNPLIYGDNSFTAQGFTGAVASFDPNNMIHNSFLVGSIKNGAAAKPDGFMLAFKEYQQYIVGRTINLLVIKKYYEMNKEISPIDISYTVKR